MPRHDRLDHVQADLNVFLGSKNNCDRVRKGVHVDKRARGCLARCEPICHFLPRIPPMTRSQLVQRSERRRNLLHPPPGRRHRHQRARRAEVAGIYAGDGQGRAQIALGRRGAEAFQSGKARKPVPFSKLAERHKEFAAGYKRSWQEEKYISTSSSSGSPIHLWRISPPGRLKNGRRSREGRAISPPSTGA